MAPSESEIMSLANGRPSPASIPQLEAHLAAQVAGQAPYLFDSIRALVKHYLIFPSTLNEEKIGQACMLAMVQHPNTDFLALTYMIPTTVMSREPCASIRSCVDLLDACQFTEFWEQLETLKSFEQEAIANVAKQSVVQLQSSILEVLSRTYREAPADVVIKALNVDSLNAVTAMKHSAVESVSSDSVVFRAVPDNSKRERVFQESVSYSTITNLMSKLSQ